MVKSIQTTISNEFPLLTLETLERLERKIHFRKITPSDCELLDHYLASIGGEGMLMEYLEANGIFTFDDVDEALTRRYRYDIRPTAVTSFFSGIIHGLIDRLRDGEKIY